MIRPLAALALATALVTASSCSLSQCRPTVLGLGEALGPLRRGELSIGADSLQYGVSCRHE